DPVGQSGRDIYSPSKPRSLQEEVTNFDSFNNIFVLHGGGSYGSGTWLLNTATNVWTNPSGTYGTSSTYVPSMPTAWYKLENSGMAFRTVNNKTYLFGGSTTSASAVNNWVWT